MKLHLDTAIPDPVLVGLYYL
eukprot:SAG31_NODE_1153_length_9640_cov_2.830206_1_plen_20_part_10